MTRKRRRMLGIAFATLALLTVAVAVGSLWFSAGFGDYCGVMYGQFGSNGEWPRIRDFEVNYEGQNAKLTDRLGVFVQLPRVSGSAFGSTFLVIPCWLPAALFALVAFLLLRNSRSVPPGRCARCRYDLTGNTSGRCPECGAPTFESLERSP